MGDAETIDVAEPVEVPVESPAEDTEGSELPPSEPREPSEEREARETPGEIGSKEISQALKSLRETNPAVADALRKAYFAHQQFSEAFPSAREARAAKIAFDTVGGVEGIATLREQVQASEYLEQAAEQGDSSIIDDWIQDYPGGFKQVMPYAVTKWAQMDQQAFSQAIQPHFFGFLDRSQLVDRLSEAFDAIENGNKPAAQTLLRNIYQWIGAQKENASKIGQESADPQLNRLQEERNSLQQEKERMFRSQIGQDTYKYQQDSVTKALAPYLRTSKLSEQAKQRLSRAVNDDINSNLTADTNYQRQVKAFLAKHDAKGTADYIKAHLDTVIPSIARRAYQDLYGATPKGVRGQTAGTNAAEKPRVSAPGGVIKVPRKPSLSEIRKDSGYMEAYIGGKAIMASGPYRGKVVSWR